MTPNPKPNPSPSPGPDPNPNLTQVNLLGLLLFGTASHAHCQCVHHRAPAPVHTLPPLPGAPTSASSRAASAEITGMAPARDGAEDDSPYWGRAEKGKPAPKSSTRAGALWNFFNAACECDDCESPLTDGAPDGPTEGAMTTSTDGGTRHGPTDGPTDVPQDVESTAAPTGLGLGLGFRFRVRVRVSV